MSAPQVNSVASSPREIVVDDASEFGHSVVYPGQTTSKSLAEVLGIGGESGVSDRLRDDLNHVREAELLAERASSEVRLF
jgi:hypothetical protein